MTVEADLFDALQALVSGRVYPLVAPPGGVERPYIVLQQVGGEAVNFLAGVPSLRNGRVQARVWSDTPAEAKAIALQAEAALLGAAALRATALGGVAMGLEEDSGLFGSQQDFSIWYTP